MQFHAIQHDVIQGDHKATRARIESLLEKTSPAEGDFIVLQEMTDTGWSLELDSISNNGTLEWACSLAKQFGVWMQAGWVDYTGTRGSNCASICSPEGEEKARYTKIFTCNPLDENKYFAAGNELVILHIGEMAICPLICYDLRFPELWRLASLEGVDVFTESSSWPLKRIYHWDALIKARAIENQAFVVGCNRSGNDTIAEWGGSSRILSPLGEILAEAPETGNLVISANIEYEKARQWRHSFPAMDDIRKELLGNIKVTHIYA
jgi:omega-amidase